MNQFTNPYVQQPRQSPYYVQPTNNGINWVQGIEGAKAWQLTPNSNAMLLDNENEGVFYIKVSDNVGMCTLRVFKYEEVTPSMQPQQQGLDLSEYVKKSELEAYINNLLGGTNDEQAVPRNDTK